MCTSDANALKKTSTESKREEGIEIIFKVVIHEKDTCIFVLYTLASTVCGWVQNKAIMMII